MQRQDTFDAFISGFTLWTGLISLSSLILVARSAHWESTFIACNKRLSIHCYLYFIPTDLTTLSTQFFHRLNL